MIRPAALLDEVHCPARHRRNDLIPSARARRQHAVVTDLMRSRRRDERSQSLQKLMPLHQDMGRSVSPACLESIGEAPIGHRFEPIGCERRTGHITTQTFEPIPIVSEIGKAGR